MRLTHEMTYMDQIKQYIANKEFGKPILLNDVVHNFSFEDESSKKIRNTISACLNRLVKSDELKKFDDGIFYKAQKNVFGETPIDYSSLIDSLYFFDEENTNRIGYRVGAKVLASIGITNNLENRIEIVTNNYNKKKIISLIDQNINLKKPVLEVTNENYLYLQLLDTIKEIRKYHLTDHGIGEKLINYMKANNIQVDKLFRYAKDHYSEKTLSNLVYLLTL